MLCQFINYLGMNNLYELKKACYELNRSINISNNNNTIDSNINNNTIYNKFIELIEIQEKQRYIF